MAADDLVTVFITTNLTEAEILRNVVRNEGIRCELENQNQAGFAGILEIKGLVRTPDEIRARLALSSYQKQLDEHQPAPDVEV